MLAFAPTPDAAKDAQYVDSESTPRRGNVLMPARPNDPTVEECLMPAQR